jgi:hypothetical protein
MRTFNGQEYDLCDPQIRCNADKEGATIFTIYNHGTWKVLAFSEVKAEKIVEDHLESEQH